MYSSVIHILCSLNEIFILYIIIDIFTVQCVIYSNYIHYIVTI